MAAHKRQPKPSVEAEAGPRLEVEYLAVKALTPYARNSRTHSDAQVAQIAASIREFGFTNPILIDDRGTIIAGHGRLMAAMRLGLAEVPTICLGHLTAEQRRAYVIADNRLALNAGWDMEMLAAEVRTIQNDIDGGLVEFGLDILGFDTPELAEMLDAMDGAGDGDAGDGGDAENETPAVQAVPISRPGEVWLLGAHRLICGDATDPKVVAAVFDGEKPGLMVTDPPYGVNYDPEWRKKAGVNNSDRMGKVKNDDRADWREVWALFPGAVAYIWHASAFSDVVMDSLRAVGFDVRQQLIWAKARMALGRSAYHWKHEPCWYAVRKGSDANWKGGRKQTTLWTLGVSLSDLDDENIEAGLQDEDAATVHGTQKPVELMRRPILNHTDVGGVVYDPFMGSGTTLIAAQTAGRVCLGCELDPVYVDVAVRRWQAFTGQRAKLAGDGRTFDEVAAERA
jgi:DNA modification methylase